MLTLIAHAGDEHVGEVDERDSPEVFATIKADPGNVSLKTAREEVDKLTVVCAIGVAPTPFAEVTPKVVTARRARAAVEVPSPQGVPQSRETPPQVSPWGWSGAGLRWFLTRTGINQGRCVLYLGERQRG